MKSAIGGSYLLYIVVFIVGAIILLFVGILSYSKAYKVKNRIIEIIETSNGYSTSLNTEINDSLLEVGYQSGKCTESGNLHTSNDFKYCVFEIKKGNGVQYKVITYTQFEIPIIKSLLTWRVSGTTKVLKKDYNY